MAQRFRNFNFLGRIWMMSEDNDFKVKNLDGYAKKNFFYYANKRIFDVLGGLIGLTISAIPIAILRLLSKKMVARLFTPKGELVCMANLF